MTRTAMLVILFAGAIWPATSAAQTVAAPPRVDVGGQLTLCLPYSDPAWSAGPRIGFRTGRRTSVEGGFDRHGGDFRNPRWDSGLYGTTDLAYAQINQMVPGLRAGELFLTIGGGFTRTLTHHPGIPGAVLLKYQQPYVISNSYAAFLAGGGWQRALGRHLLVRAEAQLLIDGNGLSPRFSFGASVPIGRRSTPGQSAAAPQPLDWSGVRAVASGSGVLIATTGAKLAARRLVRADKDSVVVLNLDDPALGSARDRLVDLAKAEPGRLAEAAAGAQVEYALLRLGPDGVFYNGRHVADVDRVLERFPRADVTEMAYLPRTHWKLGLAVGGAGGAAIGVGLSGLCEGGASCPLSLITGFGAIGAGVGAIVGWMTGDHGDRMIYRATPASRFTVQPVVTRHGAGLGAVIDW